MSSSQLGLLEGNPLISNPRCEVVEDCFKRMLAIWKKQYLPKVGTFSLVKCALSDLPIFCLSLSFLKQLEIGCCLPFLGCLGCYLHQLEKLFQGGIGHLRTRSIGGCGNPDLYVCFEYHGRQEIELPLRGKSSLSKG